MSLIPLLNWLRLASGLVAGWGALRILTAWGYKPWPIGSDRLAATAGWLALSGAFGNGASLFFFALSSSAGLWDRPSGSGFALIIMYAIPAFLMYAIPAFLAFWAASKVIRRVNWPQVVAPGATDSAEPTAAVWKRPYLVIAACSWLLWPVSLVTYLVSFLWLTGSSAESLAFRMWMLAYMSALMLAVWQAGALVGDLRSSRLLSSTSTADDPHLPKVLWVGAVGLLSAGLSAIPTAVLDVANMVTGASWRPNQSGLAQQAVPWIVLALISACSWYLFRLLPWPRRDSDAGSTPDTLRNARRATVAVAIANAMIWPFTWIRELFASLPTMGIGPQASRVMLIAVAIAVVAWMLFWRPRATPDPDSNLP